MADGLVEFDVRANLDNLQKDMDSAQDTAKKGGNKLADIAGKSAKAIGAAAVGVGTAAVAAGGYAVNLANDVDKAMNSFLSSTGYAADETGHFQNVLEKIYANNYGEDFQDIADGMATVTQNLGEMSDEQLQSITESAFALRDTFEYDISESTRAAKAMMDNFGVSGDEAMSMIAAGAQNGLDYSGELIDSISEYSTQFAKVGLDADDMFKIFEKGAESGAWNLDKVGDAVKEFSIRAIDGSDSTDAGFTAIGLNADEMAAKFGQGGETAKKAFSDTLKALSSIEDPLEKDAAGVALFGTMWEDLGPEAVEALADIEDGAYDTYGALDDIKGVKYDDLGSMFEGLKRSVEMLVLPLGEMLIPVLSELIEEVLPVLQEILPPLLESFESFLPTLIEMSENLLPIILDVFTQLAPILMSAIEEILPPLMEALQALMPVFTMIVHELLPPLLDLFTQLMPIIVELATALIPPLVEVFNALIPPIVELINALLPPLTNLLNGLFPLVDSLKPIISGLASVISDVLGEAVDAVIPIIEGIVEVLEHVIDFISNVFKGNWEGAWNSIVEVFKSIFNNIPVFVENILNGAIGIINSLINGVNKITDKVGIPAIPTIPEVTLPRFHTGGIIDFQGEYEAPIMALDGEMVLTKMQQKRLFDIANGMYSPQQQGSESVIENRTTEVKIEHKNYFTVRNDTDILRISEALSRQEVKDIKSSGG